MLGVLPCILRFCRGCAAKAEHQDRVPLVLRNLVTSKQDDIARDIGVAEVRNIFLKRKAISGFLAYCQTAVGLSNSTGTVVPTSILLLILAEFTELHEYKAAFSEINEALHERRKS